MKIDVEKYLSRIGFKGSPEVNITTLVKLQECHLLSVPFENFDIINRKPLSLEIPDLYDKVVIRHRGGCCFELNALFGCLLRELGFNVTDLISRFWRYEQNTPPMLKHHILKVDLDAKSYICDVGVGVSSPHRPVELIDNFVQSHGEDTYKFEVDPIFGWILLEKSEGEWLRLYSFNMEPQLPKDYIMACYWCENAEGSIIKKF
ncbi:MAG: N-acetyltransferase [Bacillales bacterium]|jgi:N-hydroxyarylamine O-acetyltransferase|nr:N-acetyltransferase [Bacillales bacterium]